jgi:hypothetical protein
MKTQKNHGKCKEDINFGVPYNKQSTRSVFSVSVAYRWNTYVTVMWLAHG